MLNVPVAALLIHFGLFFHGNALFPDSKLTFGNPGVNAFRVLLAGFERVGIQVVAGEKFVEVGAIAFRKARCLAHITHCYLQNL